MYNNIIQIMSEHSLEQPPALGRLILNTDELVENARSINTTGQLPEHDGLLFLPLIRSAAFRSFSRQAVDEYLEAAKIQNPSLGVPVLGIRGKGLQPLYGKNARSLSLVISGAAETKKNDERVLVETAREAMPGLVIATASSKFVDVFSYDKNNRVTNDQLNSYRGILLPYVPAEAALGPLQVIAPQE